MIFNDKYTRDLSETIENTANIGIIKNKSILITGSTGLIGSAIIDTLIYANIAKELNIHIYAAGRSKDRVRQRFSKFFDKEFFTFLLYRI